MKLNQIAAVALLLVTTSFAWGHAPKVGANGGSQADAGSFHVEDKPLRFPLATAGENRLTGTSNVSIPSEPKGAVQITTPSGSTVQAKFN